MLLDTRIIISNGEQKGGGILVKPKHSGQIMWKNNRKSQQFYVSTYGKVLSPLKGGDARCKDKIVLNLKNKIMQKGKNGPKMKSHHEPDNVK